MSQLAWQWNHGKSSVKNPKVCVNVSQVKWYLNHTCNYMSGCELFPEISNTALEFLVVQRQWTAVTLRRSRAATARRHPREEDPSSTSLVGGSCNLLSLENVNSQFKALLEIFQKNFVYSYPKVSIFSNVFDSMMELQSCLVVIISLWEVFG